MNCRFQTLLIFGVLLFAIRFVGKVHPPLSLAILSFLCDNTSCMQPKTLYSFTLTPEQQRQLADLLADSRFNPVTVPYTSAAVETGTCRVCLYTSGKCTVQGKGAADFVEFELEPKVILPTGGTGVINRLPEAPHMGSDESGKGDYFGPLVVCAAYVNAEIAQKMHDIGIRDCKTLSDRQVEALGSEIMRFLGSRYSVVQINPTKYNELYERVSNVNKILAWAHARAIENLLAVVPDCPMALADQFGGEHLIRQALFEKGRRIKLEQRHKAESDIAVAAASVIARCLFLRELAVLGKTAGLHGPLPKGASAAVIETARGLFERKGPDFLKDLCKWHFKTTESLYEFPLQ